MRKFSNGTQAVLSPGPDPPGADSVKEGTDSGLRQDSRKRSINIPILQCNLNKAHGAQVELLNKINKLKTYIALVTEPYCYKYKLSIPPKKSVIIPNKKTEQPRAAIFCSNNLLMTELTQLNHSCLLYTSPSPRD